MQIFRLAISLPWVIKRTPKISGPPRRSWTCKIPSTNRISDGSQRSWHVSVKRTDPSRIIAASSSSSSSSRTASARTATAQRYVSSTSVAEPPGCRRSAAKVPVFPGSSQLCRRLPPGTRGILERETCTHVVVTASKISFSERFRVEMPSLCRRFQPRLLSIPEIFHLSTVYLDRSHCD